MTEFWYLVAKETFADEKYISVGLIQRYLQLPYWKARVILDQLIEEKFCERQIGAAPCKVCKIN